MNFLTEILARKRSEVAAQSRVVSVEQLRDAPGFGRRTLSMVAALRARPFAVIAELKQASPSRGLLRTAFDPRAIACEFERAGASALSVLTDREGFGGSLQILRTVRDAVAVPILRKDFIIDEYQLYESKAAGADAVLLIVAALGAPRLLELKERADALGLECLIEVHTAEELDSIAGQPGALIGINNRNLETFETDLGNSLRLAPKLAKGSVSVSESGIGTGEDLRRLIRAGFHAALIGETLMRARCPGETLASLVHVAREAAW